MSPPLTHAGHEAIPPDAEITQARAARRAEAARVALEGGSTATDYARDKDVRDAAKKRVEGSRD